MRLFSEEITDLKTIQTLTHALTFEFQKAHWLVKGIHFDMLHGKFEELYNWSFETEDEIAEKLLKFGELPALDMSCGKVSTILQKHGIKQDFDNKAIIASAIGLLSELNKYCRKALFDSNSLRSDSTEKELNPELTTLYEDLLNEIQEKLWRLKVLGD